MYDNQNRSLELDWLHFCFGPVRIESATGSSPVSNRSASLSFSLQIFKVRNNYCCSIENFLDEYCDTRKCSTLDNTYHFLIKVIKQFQLSSRSVVM